VVSDFRVVNNKHPDRGCSQMTNTLVTCLQGVFSNIANAKITKINAENKAHTIFTWKTPLAQLRCEKPRPTSCRILTTSLNRAYHVTNVTHLVTTCNHVTFFPKTGYTTSNLRKIRHVQVHTTRTHSLTFD